MFTLANDPTFDVPVAGKLPGGQPFAFTLVARVLSDEQVDALTQEATDQRFTDRAMCHRLFVDWRDVGDEAGEPLPFSPENFDRLLNLFGAPAAAVTAFYKALAESREKN